MKRIGSLLTVVLFMTLLPRVAPGQQQRVETKKLVTAYDLLQAKGFRPFTPPCLTGNSSSSAFKTAVDLLSEKGLLEKNPRDGKATEEGEDDVWGLDQDFGC